MKKPVTWRWSSTSPNTGSTSMWSLACPSLLPISPSLSGHQLRPKLWVMYACDSCLCTNLIIGNWIQIRLHGIDRQQFRGPRSNNFTDNLTLFFSGVAGGLTNLSKMPACNVMLLGAQRKTLSGFSSTSVLPHTGYIYHSDIVQSLPSVSNAALGLFVWHTYSGDGL